MAGLPNNLLQTVQTYQKAELAWMLNECCAINISNKKWRDFQNRIANLGDTVTFDLAPRAFSMNGLIVNPQAAVQRVQNLVCSQAINSTIAFSDQQFIFNVRDYMDRFGKSRIMEIGAQIESDILQNLVSGVSINNPQDPNFGNSVDPASGPYRFFGDGVTNISTYQQLAQAGANFRDFGAANWDMEAIIPINQEPAIIGSGLSQFALARNNKDAYSWEIAEFAGINWYNSNFLPLHIAGTVGQTITGGGNILTLVSVNDPTGTNITQMTFSGATANDVNAIKSGDMFAFQDGVSGQPNMRFLTFIGHQPSAQPVQFRATANSAANSSGQVTISIYPALTSVPNLNQNLNNSLAPGMQVKVMNSHRAGIIMSGKPLYLAMPMLPDTAPFDSISTMDPSTGASIRHYWGTVLGQNEKIYVWDQIWGSTFVAENGMRLLFPQ